jgi:RNA polymerase sigma factor (sigma-70 family)
LDSLALTDTFGVDDVDELYRRLAARLERIVRSDVRASDAVIDDACQFAWACLVGHCERVRREAALSWLATTAVREALRLLRRDGRALSLEATFEGAGDAPAPAALAPGPDEVVERLERLEGIRALPARQQRLLWLQGFGLSYAEMARHEACTTRTVERQLLRAKAKLARAGDN